MEMIDGTEELFRPTTIHKLCETLYHPTTPACRSPWGVHGSPPTTR